MSTRDYFLGPIAIPGNASSSFPQWPKPYRLISAFARLTTDATVAVRQPLFTITEAVTGTPIARFCAGLFSAQAGATLPQASNVTDLTWAPIGCQTVSFSTGASVNIGTPLPPDLIIWPTMTLTYTVIGGVVGDSTTVLRIVIDQEPWRPGYYTPNLPRAKRGPRRSAPEPDASQ